VAYKEAPALADLVKAGKLPAIDKRLPEKPRVITPTESTGKYGGTWHRAYKGLSDRWGPTKLLEEQMIQWDWTPQNEIKLAANLCEKWEQNAAATEFTFFIRKGIKWSDGEEFNTDDVKFWYEDVLLNKDITPTVPSAVTDSKGTPMTLTVTDKYTFKIGFAEPKPLVPITIAKTGLAGPAGGPSFAYPEHYMKKFHTKYGASADIDAALKKNSMQKWDQLWGDAGNGEGPIAFWFKNPDRPVIGAWKTSVSPLVNQQRCAMVRNPYFWKVDPSGNQLPYIDEVLHDLYENDEVLNIWIVGGKIDAQSRNIPVTSYTLYKENEKKGDFKVVLWRSAGAKAFHLNLNVADPITAKLFDTPKFRQALSISINRKEINDIVYNGLFTPRMFSPVKGSPNYDPDFEKKWTEFDPATANKLLDELGLTKGADGYRKRSDGKTLDFTVLIHNASAYAINPDEWEVIKKHWQAIGVKVSYSVVERSLYEQRCREGDVEIGTWDLQRCSIVMADPGAFIAQYTEGPWAPLYGNWYQKNSYKKVEPPADHLIRKVWAAWDACKIEADETKRNALFKSMLDIHKDAPWMIGTCGENPVVYIVKNSMKNVPVGRIDDDTLRSEGLGMPCQYYFA
jgi:peptide/nickel transport system substrate-binding protein